MPQSRTAQYLILALAVFVGFYWQIGSMPLFDLDEGAFTTATREMFLRHDFITPYLNSVPRFDKPILIYWLQALSASVFGFNEFAFRLPSALASTAWVLLIYRFVRLVTDDRRAFFAALIAATSLLTTVIGKAAIADALLMLFLTSAMFAIFRHWQTRKRAWILWAFVAMAFGFLTKGPVAVVLPAAISLLFYASTGRFRDWWRAVIDWKGWLLFLVIASPWYIMEYLQQGQAFIDGFFLKHNLGRFDSAMEGHSAGFWFYPVVTFVALLPFTGTIVRAIGGLRTDWAGGVLRRDLDDEAALVRFGWVWFGFVLILFSFSSTKLPHYLNYGLVGLIIVMAGYLPQLKNRWLHLGPVWFMLVLLLALPGLVNLFFDRIHPAYVQEMLADRGRYFSWSWYVPLALFLVLSLWAGLRKVSLSQLFVPVALSFSLVMNGMLLPVVAALQQGPIKQAGLIARDLPGPAMMIGMNTPSFGVYSGKILVRRDPEPGDLILTRTREAEKLDGKILYARGGVVLLRYQ